MYYWYNTSMTDSFNESIGNRSTFQRDNLDFDSSSLVLGPILSRTPETHATSATVSRIMRQQAGDTAVADSTVPTSALLIPQFSESKFQSEPNTSFGDLTSPSPQAPTCAPYPHPPSSSFSANMTNPNYPPTAASSNNTPTPSTKYGMSLFGNMSNPSDFSDPLSFSFLQEDEITAGKRTGGTNIHNDNNDPHRTNNLLHHSLGNSNRGASLQQRGAAGDATELPKKKDSMSTLSPSTSHEQSTPTPSITNNPSITDTTNPQNNISSIFRQKSQNPMPQPRPPSQQQHFLMYSSSSEVQNISGSGMAKKGDLDQPPGSNMKVRFIHTLNQYCFCIECYV